MATIVQHKESGQKFILIGTGFGEYLASRPSFIGGVAFPTSEKGTSLMACVCDSKGRMGWIPSETLNVIIINEQRIEKLALVNEVGEFEMRYSSEEKL